MGVWGTTDDTDEHRFVFKHRTGVLDLLIILIFLIIF